MNWKNHKYLAFGIAFVLLISGAYYIVNKGPDYAAAKVNGNYITKDEMEKEYVKVLTYYEKTARKLSDKEKAGLKREILGQVIIKELVRQEAQKRNITVTDKDVDEYIRKEKQKKKEFFNVMLNERRMNEKEYREKVKYDKIYKAVFDIVTKDVKDSDKQKKFNEFLGLTAKNSKVKIYVEFD